MVHQRVREIALELTAFESVTDGEGESRFGAFLADYLRRIPAFYGKPELVLCEPTRDDPRERSVVYALLRGEGRGTVILTGHYDVVSSAAYGRLEPWAFDPEALAPRLVEELREAKRGAEASGLPPSTTEARALRDLESGAFLPGRGLLDMKAGLAAGIRVMEEFAALPARKGNILFLAVPDEEGSSRGMLSALRRLPSLCAEWGLEPRLAINLDASVDQGEGEAGRAIFLGSVGKTHPFALFLGRPSHAGAPFDGINPSLLAAEFVRRLECAPGILGGDARPGPLPSSPPGAPTFLAGAPASRGSVTAARAGEAPPPPTVLYHRDLRKAYDVTCPEAVFTSLNVLSVERSPGQVLAAVEAEATAAMEEALGLLHDRAILQSSLEGRAVSPPDRPLRVIRWSALAAFAESRDGPAFAAARSRAESGEEGDRMARLADFALSAAAIAGLEGPTAVIGLAPPYYPRAALGPEDEAFVAIAAEEAFRLGAETGQPIALRPFFPGISDMSFLCPAESPEDRIEVAAENPFGSGALPAAFRVPTLNIGPWGREYHQRLERLHAAYAFETLPLLLSRVVGRVLA